MRFNVNGQSEDVGGVEPWESLLFVLRERLGLYGSKNACEQGECGSCSIFLDDVLVCSCLVPAARATGREVTTVEGLDDDALATSIRGAMRDGGAVQCGFCTPGFVVSATALLRRDPDASPADLAEGLSGNLCRCTGYRKILEAIGTAQRCHVAGGGSCER
ncbi:(2Fe-2S)-binding protein [Nocardioides sp. LHG3406-4]|uniref:(2Fe-2S)-binding protein n=1 Tax=Nocardioides sp. LHG3406-4 TaxID=2804575 RepID=UPI003CE8D60E